MIDGSRTVAKIGNKEICLYEAMRGLALEFAHGAVSIEEFLETLEYMAHLAGEEKKFKI